MKSFLLQWEAVLGELTCFATIAFSSLGITGVFTGNGNAADISGMVLVAIAHSWSSLGAVMLSVLFIGTTDVHR